MHEGSAADKIFASEFLHFKTAPHTHYYSQRDFPQWHRGREKYYFWGVDIQDQTACQRIQQYKELLSPFLLDNYNRQPHITLLPCGFENQYADSVCLLDQYQSRAFNVTVHGPSSFLTCPFLEVEDCDLQLSQLRQHLQVMSVEEGLANYTPHVTLGLYAAAHPTTAILHVMHSSLPAPPIELHVDQLTYFSYDTRDIGSSLCIEGHYALG